MIPRFSIACIPLAVWLFSGAKLLVKSLYLALHYQFSLVLSAELFAIAWIHRFILSKSMLKQHELDAQLLIKKFPRGLLLKGPSYPNVCL